MRFNQIQTPLRFHVPHSSYRNINTFLNIHFFLLIQVNILKAELFGQCCICNKRTKRLLLLNPLFPLYIFSITVFQKDFRLTLKTCLHRKASPPSLSFPLPFCCPVSCSVFATVPISLTLLNSHLTPNAHSVKELNSPRGYRDMLEQMTDTHSADYQMDTGQGHYGDVQLQW